MEATCLVVSELIRGAPQDILSDLINKRALHQASIWHLILACAYWIKGTGVCCHLRNAPGVRDTEDIPSDIEIIRKSVGLYLTRRLTFKLTTQSRHGIGSRA